MELWRPYGAPSVVVILTLSQGSLLISVKLILQEWLEGTSDPNQVFPSVLHLSHTPEFAF